jgi:sulfite exporter TauE/SafE
MIDPATINTTAGAFAAGLATSVHCVGMCGPLACLAGSGGKVTSRGGRALGSGGYHLGRIASYAGVGALAGWLGRAPLEAFSSTPLRVLPWALVAALVAVAFGLEKRIPQPQFIRKLTFRTRMALGRRHPAVGGSLLGVATPLLPCAPLYLMFGLALLSGSAAAGAEFTAAFALGTVPLLLLASGAFGWMGTHLSPKAIPAIRKAVALLAAATIVARLVFGTPMEAPEPACPFCTGEATLSQNP